MNEEIKRLMEATARRLNINVERLSIAVGTAGGVVWWEARVHEPGELRGSITPRIISESAGETIEQALESLSMRRRILPRLRVARQNAGEQR